MMGLYPLDVYIMSITEFWRGVCILKTHWVSDCSLYINFIHLEIEVIERHSMRDEAPPFVALHLDCQSTYEC